VETQKHTYPYFLFYGVCATIYVCLLLIVEEDVFRDRLQSCKLTMTVWFAVDEESKYGVGESCHCVSFYAVGVQM